MDAAVERLLGFRGVAVAAMFAAYGVARAPAPPADPWAPRPEVRVSHSHVWPPDDVEELTADARGMLGRVFGLR